MITDIMKKFLIIEADSWLQPYQRKIEARYNRYNRKVAHIEDRYGSISKYANGALRFGLTYDNDLKGWWYKEWAPAADALYLTGDFNSWDKTSHPLYKLEDGIWAVFLPDTDYKSIFTYGLLYKVVVVKDGVVKERLPAYTLKAVQDEKDKSFAAEHCNLSYDWKYGTVALQPGEAPKIYECHIGMAQEQEGVGTYIDFAEKVLPRIAALGYNCIQFMAIQEHPYYGSFGYHVSNFFAASSRFGSPQDLKYLIDQAHALGIVCIIDIVHSHAVKNEAEGLNNFDGSGHQYFHAGERGHHKAWDSKLFDYNKDEVQLFLLSNLKFWLEEYRFDGFRFDGVTSMLYHHNGLEVTFDSYEKYFDEGVDEDAILYLQLATTLIKAVRSDAIVVAEDFSGMPGLCRPVEEGGVGFDYRLAMGIPDHWIKMLKEQKDEEWDIAEIWRMLSNRRLNEKNISYVESHDQAMVGDKTTAFWLMDAEMYWSMSKDVESTIVDRGIAVHKLLRALTSTAGGEGYLNFIGNEYGHPEWIDFPREGNNWSHKHARRQWSLVDNPLLKYSYLNSFDHALMRFLTNTKIMSSAPARLVNIDQVNQTLVFERNGVYCLFNLSASNSIPDYQFTVQEPGVYQVLLCSDDDLFGGFGRIDISVEHHSYYDNYGNHRLSVYATNRTFMALKKVR